MTECKTEKLEFQEIGRRKVESGIDDIDLSSDGGAILLRDFCEEENIFSELAEYFSDHQDSD